MEIAVVGLSIVAIVGAVLYARKNRRDEEIFQQSYKAEIDAVSEIVRKLSGKGDHHD